MCVVCAFGNPQTLERVVKERALQRLKIEQLEQHPDIAEAGGEFFGDPLGFAMHKFLFFKCFECKTPYFGGAYECQDAAVVVNHRDLLCVGMNPFILFFYSYFFLLSIASPSISFTISISISICLFPSLSHFNISYI